MKKTVLALLVVLLLGTFVACNGEVDFLLWEDEAAETKTVTLKSNDSFFRFDLADPNSQEKTFEIPATAETWADLVDVLSFTIYNHYDDSYNMTCSTYGDFIVISADEDNSLYFWVKPLEGNDVLPTDLIDSSATYKIYIDA